MVILLDDESHRVAVWELQVICLKIRGSHLTCKVANECLNVCEWKEVVVRRIKVVSSLPLLSCELSVLVKENRKRKKNYCIFTCCRNRKKQL